MAFEDPNDQNIDVSAWDKRNVWPLASGELAVRPGGLNLYSPPEGRTFVAGFPIADSTTNTTWYVVFDANTSGDADVFLRLYDENFVVIQDYQLHLSTLPRTISLSIVQDEFLITSPDFPSIYGLVGGTVTRAIGVDGVTKRKYLTTVPQGISVSWAGRTVIATLNGLYFSDALFPRSFVGENTANPMGASAIYGLHVNGETGDLIVATTNGVYKLPLVSAANAEIVFGVFTKLTDYSCIGYQTTAISQGHVYGLTKKGIKLIDVAGVGNELLLDEKLVNRTAKGGRLSFPDYRAGKLYGGTFGPIVSIGGFQFMTDLATNTSSWWHIDDDDFEFGLVGLLHEQDGTELYITPGGILRFRGNVDLVDTAVKGYLAGRFQTPPKASPVIRVVQFATDSLTQMGCSVNGVVKTRTVPQVFPIVGFDTWDDGIFWRDPPLRSRQIQFNNRKDDIQFELQIYGHPTRLPDMLNCIFAGPGKTRRD